MYSNGSVQILENFHSESPTRGVSEKIEKYCNRNLENFSIYFLKHGPDYKRSETTRNKRSYTAA